MKKSRLVVILLLSSLCAMANVELKEKFEWQDFIKKQDLHFSKIPGDWDEGPFLGNGRLGLMIYREPGKNYIRFEIGNSQVHDHRNGDGMYNIPRLLIGQFNLTLVGEIIDGHMHLDLWNAEATGEIKTSKGSISFTALVPSGEDVIVISVKTTGEENYEWKWVPASANSPRYLYALQPNVWYKNPSDYELNPVAVDKTTSEGGQSLQKLKAGGETAVVWKNQKKDLYINITHKYPENNSLTEAWSIVNDAIKKGLPVITKSHRKWWNNYYQQSFVSIPDSKIEAFYWVQMYKLASATREDGEMIDNTGPWLTITPWPGTWWNLNVQLAYWPLNASNRLSLGKSLENTIYNHVDVLINNVPEPYRYNSAGIGRSTDFTGKGQVADPLTDPNAEIGLLTWTCHNLWLLYRYKMDDQLLEEKLYPLLKKSINYYLHFLKKDGNGIYHLPSTHSPEYGPAEDCNFDLLLLRWGCQTLLYTTERLHINDPQTATWKDVLENITEYPQDSNGYMIGKNVPYAKSHRHYSHLLMIYPLYLVNTEQGKEQRDLILKSLEYWQSIKGHHEGYSQTGAASIAASIGDGDMALSYLENLFTDFLRPNTMYKEAGPVIETPLSGAQVIHDMILQSWNGIIRVFPAMPLRWKSFAFKNLRTEGAFLVSAMRENGITQFVEIESLAGEPCLIRTDIINPVVINKNIKLVKIQDNTYELHLKKGEKAIIVPKDMKVDLSISPVRE